MSPLPLPSKKLEARLLIAKSMAKNKKTKAKKPQTTTIPPAHKTKSKDKENAAMQMSMEKVKHVAITWVYKSLYMLVIFNITYKCGLQ